MNAYIHLSIFAHVYNIRTYIHTLMNELLCVPGRLQDGIQPMWEDVKNKAGGRWLLNLDKRNRDVLDRFWEETVSPSAEKCLT